MGCSSPKRQLRGGYDGGRPTCRTPSCTAAFRGDSSPQRSGKQLLVLPRNTLPVRGGLLCLRVHESGRRGCSALGSDRQQLPAAAVPSPPVPPPSEAAGRAFRCGHRQPLPFDSFLPFPLEANEIVFRVAREGVKPRYCLIHI